MKHLRPVAIDNCVILQALSQFSWLSLISSCVFGCGAEFSEVVQANQVLLKGGVTSKNQLLVMQYLCENWSRIWARCCRSDTQVLQQQVRIFCNEFSPNRAFSRKSRLNLFVGFGAESY